MVATRRCNMRNILLCGCVILAGGTVAVAQTSVAALVADLGSSDLATREEATRVLASDDSLGLSGLEAALRNPALTLEQRARLQQAAKRRFMESPRPALGVRFDSALPDRVAIEEVYPNFPASAVLQPGDLIVECEGERLRSRGAWVSLGAHIFSREAGETIRMTVRRGKEKMELEVGLGRFADLGADGRGPSLDRLEHAWQLRCSKFAPEPAAPIDVGMADEEWRAENSYVESQKLTRFKSQLPQVVLPSIVAGGEPRGGAYGYDELLAMSQPNHPNAPVMINQQAWAQRQLVQAGGPGGWNSTSMIIQTTKQELGGLQNRRVLLQRQLDLLEAPGAAKPGEMAEHQQALTQYRNHLTRVVRQIDAISAEAAEEPEEAGGPRIRESR